MSMDRNVRKRYYRAQERARSLLRAAIDKALREYGEEERQALLEMASASRRPRLPRPRKNPVPA